MTSTTTVRRYGSPQLFLRRGFGQQLIEPTFLGRWTIEAECDDGRVQMYATDADNARTYDYDPKSGQATPGLPDWIRRALRAALHGTAGIDFIHNFATWLFKWDSRDFAWELANDDWDPRDL